MILIVLDNLTKFVYLKTLTKGTATKIVEFLRDELFPLFSVPETIHSDNGVQFVGKEFTALVKELGIYHIKTAYYSPQSNASERVNRSIVAALRAYVRGKHSNWDKFLPEVGSALRNAIHQSTNYSPHFLLFGYHKIQHANDYRLLREVELLGENSLDWMGTPDRLAIIHKEVKGNIVKDYNKYSQNYNLRTRHRSLNLGQQVYVKQHPVSDAANKFTAKFAYPYLKAFVKEKRGELYYVLVDGNNKELGTFHLMDIKT